MGATQAAVGDRVAYYAGKFLAQTGQNLLFAALVVAAGTSSAAAVGLSSIFVAMLIPAIFLGLPAGAIVDRIGAPRGYALGAALRLLPVVAGLAIIGNGHLAFVIAAAYSAGSQIFTPAELAMVHVVQRNASGRAHSLLIALQYAGQGTGVLLLAPALYFIGGPHAMLVGAAAAFAALVAVALYLAIRLPGANLPAGIPRRRAFAFGETFRYFGRERRAGYAVGLLAYKATAAKCIVVALPLYMQRDLGLGNEAVAYLLLPGVVGVGVGLLWGGSLNLRTAPSAMRLAMIGMTVSVFALAALDYGLTAAAQYSHVPPIARLEASLNTTFVVAVPVAFLLGLCFATALISSRVVLTETAPPHQQARVFASQITLTESVIILPLMLAGVGTQFAGARPMLAVLGVLGVVTFLFLEAARAARPIPQTAAADHHEPAPEAA